MFNSMRSKPLLLSLPALIGGENIPRVTLPQDLQQTALTLMEDFEVIGDWTVAGGSAAANNTAGEFRTGAQSIKVTSAVGANGRITKPITWTLDGTETWRIHVYVHDLANLDYITVTFADAAIANYFYLNIQDTTLVAGWNVVNIVAANWVQAGAPVWGNMNRFRVWVTPQAGVAANVSFDTFQRGTSQAAVLLTFDDQFDTVYSAAFPYMSARGVVGTAYTVTSSVGIAGRMTWAQLLVMYRAGWSVANHTHDHDDLTTYTQVQVRDECDQAQALLDANGFSRDSEHLAYPLGAYNDTVIAGAEDALMATGRAVTFGVGNYVPPGDWMTLRARSVDNVDALATITGLVDTAITLGQVLILVFHQIVTPADIATKWEVVKFQGLIDYLVTHVADITPITIDELYRLDSGAVTVRKPHAP